MERSKLMCVGMMLPVSLGLLSQEVVYGTAEGEIPDSVLNEKTVMLNEVTVKGVPVIRKVDRDLYVPSAETRLRSQDGLELLSNMQLPAITVNVVLNTISRGGEGVEVRINGRRAEMHEVKSIDPSTVVRVEYHDTPSMRYGKAGAVIDIIVKNRQRGGQLRADVMQSLGNRFGNQNANLKLNSGNAQWEAGYYGQMRLDLPMYRENEENYRQADGEMLSRHETPTGGMTDYYEYRSYVAYNHVKVDKSNFWTQLYLNRNAIGLMSYEGLLSADVGNRTVAIVDNVRSPGMTTGVNVYADYKLGEGQTVVFDINAGAYVGYSHRNYTETAVDDGETVVAIDNRISDRNYKVVAEADYIKEWSRSKLTLGCEYTFSRSRARYDDQSGVVDRRQENEVNAFAEYQHRLGRRLSLSAGLGLVYTNAGIIGSRMHVDDWLLCPMIMASYNADERSQLKLVFATDTRTPSLNQLSTVSQEIDLLQSQVGNPDLKPYNSYRLDVRYNYAIEWISGQLSVYMTRSPQAIMDCRNRDSATGRIVASWNNQSGMSSWGVSLSPRIVLWPGWATLSGTLSFHRDYSHGKNYRHTIGRLSGNAQLVLTHWGVTMVAMYQKGYESLWGETVNVGESVGFVQVGYRWRGLGFNAGMFMPIGRYSRGSEVINRDVQVKRTIRTRAIEQMPFVSVSYNFSWGHKTRNVNRLINNDAGVQRSQSAGK